MPLSTVSNALGQILLFEKVVFRRVYYAETFMEKEILLNKNKKQRTKIKNMLKQATMSFVVDVKQTDRETERYRQTGKSIDR